MGAGLAILGVFAIGYGVMSKPKKKAKKQLPPPADAPEAPRPPDEDLVIVWEQDEWFIPEGWLETTGTDAMRAHVLALSDAGTEVDPVEVSWQILQDQLAGHSLPPTPHPPDGSPFWQANVPTATNYYDGPESVLGLYYHVAEHVDDALGRWISGDDLYLAESPYEDAP